MKLRFVSSAMFCLVCVLVLGGCHDDDTDANSDSSSPSTGNQGPSIPGDPSSAIGSNVAANILVTAQDGHIFVAGVGHKEITYINIQLLDRDGHTVADANPGVNNILVNLTSRPRGGEKLFGTNAGGVLDETTYDDDTLELRSISGAATLALQAGTLPGVIEIQVEALDPTGNSLTNPVQAVVSQIVISSGPPHTIVVSTPHQVDKVVDLPGGFYQQVGTVTVTDRFGNAVPDGTAINLGVVDSVIHRGAAGRYTTGSTTFTDTTTAPFTTASVYRNQNFRFIEPNDRLLLVDVAVGDSLPTADRSRFIAVKPLTDGTLEVNKPYLNSRDPVQYKVGAALLGASISGVEPGGDALLPGRVFTQNGLGTFYLSYPSDWKHIYVGCGLVPLLDTRHTLPPFTTPDHSADVYVIASSADDPTTAAVTDPGEFCFGAVAPGILNVFPKEISSSADIGLELKDSGDEVPLPYQSIFAFVNISKKGPGSTFNVTATNCELTADPSSPNVDTSGLTQPGTGVCVSRIEVTGTLVTGDSAEVTYKHGELEATVTVKIP